jgi:GINS complex subunit 2
VLLDMKGDFGPFQPGITTQVPLWLAVMLKQLNKCRIIAPSWFSVGAFLPCLIATGVGIALTGFPSCIFTEYLTTRLEQEKAIETFDEMPFHYLEIASLLFKKCALPSSLPPPLSKHRGVHLTREV